MLYINTVEHTPDGRSLITTTGEKRFRVVERGGCDGYNTSKIQFIVDEPVTDLEEIGEYGGRNEDRVVHGELGPIRCKLTYCPLL